jgi:hypothetical protein
MKDDDTRYYEEFDWPKFVDYTIGTIKILVFLSITILWVVALLEIFS